MDQINNHSKYLKTDLVTLIVVIGLFTIVLAGLVVMDVNTNIITNLGKKIAGFIIS